MNHWIRLKSGSHAPLRGIWSLTCASSLYRIFLWAAAFKTNSELSFFLPLPLSRLVYGYNIILSNFAKWRQSFRNEYPSVWSTNHAQQASLAEETNAGWWHTGYIPYIWMCRYRTSRRGSSSEHSVVIDISWQVRWILTGGVTALS